MISLYNEYNETGDYQAFISAKECENNKDNFLKILKEELMDDNIELAGEVEEGYYRIKRSDEWERDELGEYCWTPTQKGRGATLFYMADWKFKKEVI